MEEVKVFISYSHGDTAFQDALKRHLMPLIRNKKITYWSDRVLFPGVEWDRRIKHELEEADIILLLVSSYFLASEYCDEIEVRRAIEKHNAGEALVIPVIVRPCSWKSTPFAHLQAMPIYRGITKSVQEWQPQDKAWHQVVLDIEKV